MGESMVRVSTAPIGIGSSPIEEICSGSLPKDARGGIDVDWSDVTFCSVSQMAAIAAVQLAGVGAHSPQRYTMPKSEACSYMIRMDYYKVLGIEREESFVRHDPRDRFVPLTKIPIDENEADPGGIAKALKQVVSTQTGLDKSAADILDLAFCEVIDNVVQHSKAISPGLACAQYYPRGGYVEACVADCGVGIVESMRGNPLYSALDESEAMLAAFNNNTGEWYQRSRMGTNEVSGGIGLSYPARLIEALDGHLWAVSMDSAVHIHSGGRNPIDGLWYPGTLIVLRIPNVDKIILESDIWDDGEPMPIYWNEKEGRNYGEWGDNCLW